MKTTHNPSVHNVRQRRRKPRGKGPLKSVRIGGRATPEVAAAIPPGEGVGVFLERLLKKRKGDSIYSEEMVRTVAWACVCLDQLVFEVPSRFPDDPGQTLEERINQLAAVANFTEVIADLRTNLGGLFHAR
jgi:hypothetical protein